MDRRGFIKCGGLFGTLLGAAAVPSVVEKITMPAAPEDGVSNETITQLESNISHMQLHAQYGEKITEPRERARITSDGFYFAAQPEYNNTVSVTLKPGPDGELYIKKNGQWQKILTT